MWNFCGCPISLGREHDMKLSVLSRLFNEGVWYSGLTLGLTGSGSQGYNGGSRMIYIEWAKKSTDSEEFKDWSSERMFPSHKSFSLATCLVASFLEFLTKPKNSKELPGRSSSYKYALLYFCLSLWPPVIQYQKLWDHSLDIPAKFPNRWDLC